MDLDSRENRIIEGLELLPSRTASDAREFHRGNRMESKSRKSELN